jgi:hypothetical protein
MKIISVKIIGHKRARRYPLERAVIAAQQELPNATLFVEHIKTAAEFQQYLPVFSMLSLMVNEKLICVRRFPKKVEVLSLLREAEKSLTCRSQTR